MRRHLFVRWVERRRPWLINCGHCGGRHHSIDTVRACSRGSDIWRCTWLIERGRNEDGEPIITECGAESWDMADGRGYECAAGHWHVSMEHRDAEGWDFASDYQEAEALSRSGVYPVRMDGGPWTIVG